MLTLMSYAFLCSVEHKRRYLEECWFPLNSIVFFCPMEVIENWNCLVTSILSDIFFYVQQNKESHTGLEQHEGEWTPFK